MLPAADGKFWWAEVEGRSEERLQQGQSSAQPSAPGTTALSLQQGAAASPSGGEHEKGDRVQEGNGGEERSGNEGNGKGR